MSLDSRKACGIDNISPIIFKNCVLLQVVCHLFSTSLRRNSIPQKWHTHCVIPIYKPGTSHLYPIIDLFPYFIFSPKYQKELSTITSSDMYTASLQNINLASYLIDQLCSNCQYLLKIFLKPSQKWMWQLCMDFTKAFDLVSHNSILNKLWNHRQFMEVVAKIYTPQTPVCQNW